MKKKRVLVLSVMIMASLTGCIPRLAPEQIEYMLKRTAVLETYSYTYRDMVYITDPNLLARIFNTDTPLLFSINYKVKAGIDMQDIRAERTGINLLAIKLIIPSARITTLDAEETSIDQYFGRRNAYNLNEIIEKIGSNKAKIEQAAISDGILKKAENNAIEILSDWLRKQGYRDIIVIIQGQGIKG
ncbi:DUF4230 domain-containing protein [Spirochaetia bacterium 38H-sp]|uniref:DUF4230 domain-containing protein n=1 Tax=Rarispira pelagica TaxID=3141764 RepID=A0ABU9UBG0_9SPIR